VPIVLSAVSLCAEELANYRDFRLERGLDAVVKQLGGTAADAKVVHERPALIEEIRWHASYAPSASVGGESVKQMQFSFYNGTLYRIVVMYDRQRTDGLTVEDMIAVLSATYGSASKSPAAELLFPSMYNETVGVLARWEDEHASVNLVRSTYNPTYGLILLSQKLDALAQASIREARTLDDLEAPLRESQRQKKAAEGTRLQLEKSRLANKETFRP
jgi:hypothetical protein